MAHTENLSGVVTQEPLLKRFRAWLHHRKLLLQYTPNDRKYPDNIAVTAAGSFKIKAPPRYGSRSWEFYRREPMDSSEILYIDDKSLGGY